MGESRRFKGFTTDYLELIAKFRSGNLASRQRTVT